MKQLSKEDRAQWRNIWCALKWLNFYQVDAPGFDWDKFESDPHAYLIRTDDRQAAAIWSAVERRLK